MSEPSEITPAMTSAADQAYAAAQVYVDKLITSLIEDMTDREARDIFDDAVSWMITRSSLERSSTIEFLALVTSTLLYRFARQENSHRGH